MMRWCGACDGKGFSRRETPGDKVPPGWKVVAETKNGTGRDRLFKVVQCDVCEGTGMVPGGGSEGAE